MCERECVCVCVRERERERKRRKERVNWNNLLVFYLSDWISVFDGFSTEEEEEKIFVFVISKVIQCDNNSFS